jgi:hypothetical protein
LRTRRSMLITTCYVSADHERGPATGRRPASGQWNEAYMLCNRGDVAARDLRVISDTLLSWTGIAHAPRRPSPCAHSQR